jgi:hypothetical protein
MRAYHFFETQYLLAAGVLLELHAKRLFVHFNVSDHNMWTSKWDIPGISPEYFCTPTFTTILSLKAKSGFNICIVSVEII